MKVLSLLLMSVIIFSSCNKEDHSSSGSWRELNSHFSSIVNSFAINGDLFSMTVMGQSDDFYIYKINKNSYIPERIFTGQSNSDSNLRPSLSIKNDSLLLFFSEQSDSYIDKAYLYNNSFKQLKFDNINILKGKTGFSIINDNILSYDYTEDIIWRYRLNNDTIENIDSLFHYNWSKIFSDGKYFITQVSSHSISNGFLLKRSLDGITWDYVSDKVFVHEIIETGRLVPQFIKCANSLFFFNTREVYQVKNGIISHINTPPVVTNIVSLHSQNEEIIITGTNYDGSDKKREPYLFYSDNMGASWVEINFINPKMVGEEPSVFSESDYYYYAAFNNKYIFIEALGGTYYSLKEDVLN